MGLPSARLSAPRSTVPRTGALEPQAGTWPGASGAPFRNVRPTAASAPRTAKKFADTFMPTIRLPLRRQRRGSRPRPCPAPGKYAKSRTIAARASRGGSRAQPSRGSSSDRFVSQSERAVLCRARRLGHPYHAEHRRRGADAERPASDRTARSRAWRRRAARGHLEGSRSGSIPPAQPERMDEGAADRRRSKGIRTPGRAIGVRLTTRARATARPASRKAADDGAAER